MAGVHGELDWHFPLWNEEMSQYAYEQLSTMDTILLGRVSYQAMAGYWPYATERPTVTEEDMVFADMMNSYTKIVFSRTLAETTWNNSKLIKGNIRQELLHLKQQPGKNMILYGSGSIVHTLMHLGLIDEYRLWIHPVLLQQGIPLFKDTQQTISLRLLTTRTFRTGVVLLQYRPQ